MNTGEQTKIIQMLFPDNEKELTQLLRKFQAIIASQESAMPTNPGTNDYNQGYAVGTFLGQSGEELDFSEMDATAREIFEELGGRTIESLEIFTDGLANGYTTTYTKGT